MGQVIREKVLSLIRPCLDPSEKVIIFVLLLLMISDTNALCDCPNNILVLLFNFSTFRCWPFEAFVLAWVCQDVVNEQARGCEPVVG